MSHQRLSENGNRQRHADAVATKKMKLALIYLMPCLAIGLKITFVIFKSDKPAQRTDCANSKILVSSCSSQNAEQTS